MGLVDRPAMLFVVLLLGLAAIEEIGIRLRSRISAGIDEARQEQIAAAREAAAVLLSLLLGFTMAMALQRYDYRVELVVDEVNAIRTTGLRAQTLTEPASSKLLELLREYVDVRVLGQELQGTVGRAKELQDQLWNQSAAAARQSPAETVSIFLQSLTQTIDLGQKKQAALENRIPPSIWLTLVLISVLTCFIVGLGVRRRFLVMTLIWPLIISFAVKQIADLDSPASGFIQVNQQSMRRL